MTDLEKAKERLRIAEEAFESVQRAANADRKLSHDKHTDGHYTSALDKLSLIVLSKKTYLFRLETIGK